MTVIKYSYLSDIHRCSFERSPNLAQLKGSLRSQIPNIPADHYIYYYDSQGDIIAVNNDADLVECLKFFSAKGDEDIVRLYVSVVNPNEDWAAKLFKRVDMPYLCDVSSKKYQEFEKTLFDLAVRAEKGLGITVDSSRKLFNKISQKVSGADPNFIYRIQAKIESGNAERGYSLACGQLKVVVLKITNSGTVPWPKDTFLSFSGEEKNIILMEGPTSLSGIFPGKTHEIKVTLKALQTGEFRCFWQIDSEDAIIPCIVPLKVQVSKGASSSTSETFEEI